jgi:hypothetical protein
MRNAGVFDRKGECLAYFVMGDVRPGIEFFEEFSRNLATVEFKDGVPVTVRFIGKDDRPGDYLRPAGYGREPYWFNTHVLSIPLKDAGEGVTLRELATWLRTQPDVIEVRVADSGSRLSDLRAGQDGRLSVRVALGGYDMEGDAFGVCDAGDLLDRFEASRQRCQAGDDSPCALTLASC